MELPGDNKLKYADEQSVSLVCHLSGNSSGNSNSATTQKTAPTEDWTTYTGHTPSGPRLDMPKYLSLGMNTG